MHQRNAQSWEFKVSAHDAIDVVDYLVSRTGISKSKLKQAMNKGAVWLQRGRSKRKRLRRATTILQAGDVLALHYAPDLLDKKVPLATMLWHNQDYSVWYKPPGLLAQGNEYGDHASLLRQAELADPQRKQVYLVHRLDREAAGLMLIAHKQAAASKLSTLFQRQQVSKEYEVTVLGRPVPEKGEIGQALEGKPALTHYSLQKYDSETNTSVLQVSIDTGRKHQIRRHLASVGYPVMGDPRYGQGNICKDGLQLKAVRLAFDCPISGEAREFVLEDLMPSVDKT